MRYSSSQSLVEGINTAVGLNTCMVTGTMDMWPCFLKLKISWDAEWDYKLIKQADSKA